MNYIHEYDLVAEDAAGFPGSSPRSLPGGIDYFSSPAAEEAGFDDDVIEIDDFDDFDTDSDLFVSDGPYAAEAEHRNFEILESDVEHEDEDDQDLVLDSGDDAIPTHYDTWDDQSVDENTPPRMSLTPLSRLGSIDLLSHVSEDDDPASGVESIENLETRYQQLRAGHSRVAVAAGSNLLLDPADYVGMSNLEMLSPTSRSRMWDKDADGYARGEGVAAVVLKTLSAAEADGDHIECIIRETATNQDGRTMGITM